MSEEHTPTTDEIRQAWWMTPDNSADNEGASDLSFDRWLAAHDAEVARQQAEHDAGIADAQTGLADDDYTRGWRRAATVIAKMIRAQFEKEGK